MLIGFISIARREYSTILNKIQFEQLRIPFVPAVLRPAGTAPR
jgi:hypothetical protein